MDARSRYLRQREADGELTPVEARELARTLEARTAAARAATRESEGWQRFEAELRSMLDQAPPLAIERIAARVEQRVAKQQTRRPWVAAASLVILGALAAAPAARAPHEQVHEAPAIPAPPVEVRVDGVGEAGGLVPIDF